jgi:hypothetical protein
MCAVPAFEPDFDSLAYDERGLNDVQTDVKRDGRTYNTHRRLAEPISTVSK